MVSDTTEKADKIEAERILKEKAAIENTEIKNGKILPDENEDDTDLAEHGYLWLDPNAHI
jgi:hypothetical protein